MSILYCLINHLIAAVVNVPASAAASLPTRRDNKCFGSMYCRAILTLSNFNSFSYFTAQILLRPLLCINQSLFIGGRTEMPSMALLIKAGDNPMVIVEAIFANFTFIHRSF